MYFGVVKKAFLSELTLLSASSLRLLTALYARALIMLTLAELGKHTSLGTGTLEGSRALSRDSFSLIWTSDIVFPPSARSAISRTLALLLGDSVCFETGKPIPIKP